jgi:hypothetical protein
VKHQLKLSPKIAPTQPTELASHFLDEVAGGIGNYPAGFINGYFASFAQSNGKGGIDTGTIEVKPQYEPPREP